MVKLALFAMVMGGSNDGTEAASNDLRLLTILLWLYKIRGMQRHSHTPAKGRFIPRNPSKYKGDPTKIIYRSSLELKLDNYFDLHPDIIEWSSEEVIVPYRDKSRNNSIHRYFPDYTFKTKTKSYMVEVKPSSQTVMPKAKRNKQRYLQECLLYTHNTSKWDAAKLYCQQHNMQFIILTEKDINAI